MCLFELSLLVLHHELRLLIYMSIFRRFLTSPIEPDICLCPLAFSLTDTSIKPEAPVSGASQAVVNLKSMNPL